MRHDISELRDDLKSHVVQDRTDIGALQSQLSNWTGQAKIIGWIAAAILTALIADVWRHWSG